MKKKLLITIDGPAGSGKTTIAKLLAKKLKYRYVDTGALYRAVAFEIIKNKVDIEDKNALSSLCENLNLTFCKKTGHIKSNKIDIEDKIRNPEIDMMASKSSAKETVRKALLNIQKSIGKEKAAIFEGRDMGTIVFPNADLKFFLTADIETRAKRRFADFQKTNLNVDLSYVENELKKRDENDSKRKLSPLKPAKDSIMIDSSNINQEEVVNNILLKVQALN